MYIKMLWYVYILKCTFLCQYFLHLVELSRELCFDMMCKLENSRILFLPHAYSVDHSFYDSTAATFYCMDENNGLLPLILEHLL